MICRCYFKTYRDMVCDGAGEPNVGQSLMAFFLLLIDIDVFLSLNALIDSRLTTCVFPFLFCFKIGYSHPQKRTLHQYTR